MDNILNNQNNIIEEQVVKYLIELSSSSSSSGINKSRPQNKLLPEKKITIINSKKNQIFNPEDYDDNEFLKDDHEENYEEKAISDYYSGCKYSSFGKDEFLSSKDDFLNHKDDFLNHKKVEEVDSLINDGTTNNPIKDINPFDKNLMKNKMLLQEVDNFINNKFQKPKYGEKLNYYEKPILKSSFVPELNINAKVDDKLYSDKYKIQLIEDIFKSINRLEITLKNHKI